MEFRETQIYFRKIKKERFKYIIDYKIQVNSSKIIYEISSENNTAPGFGISTFIGSIFAGVIAVSLLLNKKFHLIDEKKINKST